MKQKVLELLEDTQIDDNRIAAEVILFQTRSVMTRKPSVCTVIFMKCRRCSKKKKASDVKLDFMAQEMNREANTILSKSSDLEVSDIAIDLKTEIEKVREQIQNVE